MIKIYSYFSIIYIKILFLLITNFLEKVIKD